MTAGIAYPADYSATYSGPQYTAAQGRTALAAAMSGATSARPLGGISGVRPGTPSTTVTATSTTWTAAAFAGYIDTAASATNGGYFFSFPSGGTGSVTAAAASPRIDIIYVQLSDVNTGDGTTVAPKVDVAYLAGTAGSGVAPTTPARSFVLAQLNVPATGGGSPTVTWSAPVTSAAGGFLQAETLTQLNAIAGWRTGALAQVFADGTAANNIDYRWNGSAWKGWNSAWITFTPTFTNLTVNNGTLTARYKWEAGRVAVEANLVVGSTTVMGSAPNFTHPVTADAVSGAVWSCLGRATYLETGTAAYDGVIEAVSTTVAEFRVANVAATYPSMSSVTNSIPFPWATGHVLLWNYIYGPA